jgi:hypothetical protein
MKIKKIFLSGLIFCVVMGCINSSYASSDIIKYTLTNHGIPGGSGCVPPQCEIVAFSAHDAHFNKTNNTFSFVTPPSQTIKFSFDHNPATQVITKGSVTSTLTATYAPNYITLNIVTTDSSKKASENPVYTLTGAKFVRGKPLN